MGLRHEGEKINKVLTYPTTPEIPVVENWHGVNITDDYAWLEEDFLPIHEWDKQQNQITRQYLDNAPNRQAIKERIKKWMDLEQIGCPYRRGDNLFQWKRKAGENHFVLYVGTDLENQDILINPNNLSEDGTTAINWTSMSKDGKFLTYGVSSEGSENTILRVRNIESKQDLIDSIPNTQHCSVSWLPDNSGFYYTRFPEPGSVPQGEENYNRKVYLHILGGDWHQDKLIFAPNDIYKDYPSVSLSQDGKWLNLIVYRGWNSNDIYVSKISEDPTKPDFTPLAVGEDGQFYVSEYDGYHYIMTDHEAPKFKVMRVRTDSEVISDKNNWEVVVEEQENTLDGFIFVDGKIVLNYQVKACSKLEILDPNSGERSEITLPDLGSVTAINGQADKPDFYYSFESYSVPDTICKLDTTTLLQEKVGGLDVKEDLSEIVTEQITYKSKDGTPVTAFVVKNKNITNNGENKTILYGYGGFNSGETPIFSGSRLEWVKSGGVYVFTNLRGGNEYGEEWHKAGMLDKKQNVFDDFIAAADYLIENNYTKPEKLAIWGGSNGGLLVGAAMTQRPELFGAVVCQVPLLDMIHYDRLKIAKLWHSEYGDPANPEHFKFLHTYSPYHNIKDDVAYPAILLQTAKNDDRVDAMHARKMAARLQSASASRKPILLYVEDKAGHGAGKPASKILEQFTDAYTFLDLILE